jgi:MoaD family protein
MLSDAIGHKELEAEFTGTTVQDLIEHLVTHYGKKAERALYDENGELDPVIQLLLNGEEWINRDQLDTNLQDGDSVVLLMMMAGG